MRVNAFSLALPAAETPIEEFTPTPAFPALQYLESVDVEGVAWRAGLRTGDFLIEVRPGLTLPSRIRERTTNSGGLRRGQLTHYLASRLSQVNGVNVVKVGHKQVVGLIRQGGNRLVMKVVSVTRKPEEDSARRRGEGFDCWPFRPFTSGPHSFSPSLILHS